MADNQTVDTLPDGFQVQQDNAESSANLPDGFNVEPQAQAPQDRTVSIPDKGMTVSVPATVPDHKFMNIVRDNIHGDDTVPAVPIEGQHPFIQGLQRNMLVGINNAFQQMADGLHIDKTPFVQNTLMTPQEEAAFTEKTKGNAFTNYANHFFQSVGGLTAQMPFWMAGGEAIGAVGGLVGGVGKALSMFPNWVLGSAAFGAAEGEKKYEGQGIPLEAAGAAQGFSENLLLNKFFSAIGPSASMFPKMVGLSLADTTYEAAKQERLPTSKELYMATADGLAYSTVFGALGMMKRPLPEQGALDNIADAMKQAVKEGDLNKVQDTFNSIQDHPDISSDVKLAAKSIFETTQTQTQDRVRQLLGPLPETDIETPQAAEAEGKTENGLEKTGIKTPEAKAIEDKVWPSTLPEGFKGDQNAESRGGSINEGSEQAQGLVGKEKKIIDLRGNEKEGMATGEGKEKGLNESGQIDISAIPGVDRAVKAITDTKEFLKQSESGIPLTKDFQDGINKVTGAISADSFQGRQLIPTLDKSFPLSITEKSGLHDYMDDVGVHGESDIKLNEKQQALYDQLKPIQEKSAQAYDYITENGYASEGTHLTRYPVGKGNLFDKLTSDAKSFMSGNPLGKTAPELRERVMKALTNEETGSRTVVRMKNGENVTAYNKKVETDLGPNETTTYGQLREDELAKIKDQEDKLNQEYGTLTKTGKRLESSSQRVKNIESELTDLQNQRNDIIEKYADKDLTKEIFVPKKFNPQTERMETDLNGPKYSIGEATVKEIEANTDLKYHKDPVIQVLDSYLRLSRISKAVQFLDQIKQVNDPNVTYKLGSGGMMPDGFKTTDLPQFRGYAFAPKVADAMNAFYESSKRPGDVASTLMGMNRLIRAYMFLNPLVHPFNVGFQYLVGRGLYRWTQLPSYQRLGESTLKAWNDVINLNENYMNQCRDGMNMQYADVRLAPMDELLKQHASNELETNEPLRDNIAKALGYLNPMKLANVGKTLQEIPTWLSNDFFTLALKYELQAEGKTSAEAMKETYNWIPDYRMPTRILGSKELSDVLKNSNVTIFQSYHYALLKAFGTFTRAVLPNKAFGFGQDEALMKHLFDTEAITPAERLQIADKFASFALLSCVVYPQIDNLMKKLSGNPDANIRRSGMAAVSNNFLRMLKGQINPVQALETVVTPAPMTSELVEQATNRDAFTGKEIRQDEATGEEKAQESLGHFASKFTPIQKVSQVTEGKKTVGEQLLSTYAGVNLPKFVAHTDAEQQAMNIKRASPDNKYISEEDQKANQIKYNIEDQYAKDKDPSILKDAVANKQISQYQANQIKKYAKEEPIIRLTRGFDTKQLESVYDKGNPDEKKLLLPVIEKNLQGQIRKTFGPQKDELIAKLEKYRGAKK